MLFLIKCSQFTITKKSYAVFLTQNKNISIKKINENLIDTDKKSKYLFIDNFYVYKDSKINEKIDYMTKYQYEKIVFKFTKDFNFHKHYNDVTKGYFIKNFDFLQLSISINYVYPGSVHEPKVEIIGELEKIYQMEMENFLYSSTFYFLNISNEIKLSKISKYTN
ncbi:hypothetical protein GVAV_001190 [Gurleya vavrai]